MPCPPPVTNREREQMRRLRASGLSLEEIADRLGRTGRCVWDHVHDMPVRCTPGRPGMSKATRARFLAAADAGASRHELAARFSIAPSSVHPLASRLRKARRLATQQESLAC